MSKFIGLSFFYGVRSIEYAVVQLSDTQQYDFSISDGYIAFCGQIHSFSGTYTQALADTCIVIGKGSQAAIRTD